MTQNKLTMYRYSTSEKKKVNAPEINPCLQFVKALLDIVTFGTGISLPCEPHGTSFLKTLSWPVQHEQTDALRLPKVQLNVSTSCKMLYIMLKVLLL